MRIFIHSKAYNFLIKQDKDISRRIKDKLKELRDNPGLGEHLKHSKYWRLRIGDYRAIYKVEGEKIIVLFIGHRRDVYDDFSKLFWS